MSDSFDPITAAWQGSCPYSPGKNTRVGCHFLLQGIFPTQALNPGLLHCRQILYQLSHQGNPNKVMRMMLIQYDSSPYKKKQRDTETYKENTHDERNI